MLPTMTFWKKKKTTETIKSSRVAKDQGNMGGGRDEYMNMNHRGEWNECSVCEITLYDTLLVDFIHLSKPIEL